MDSDRSARLLALAEIGARLLHDAGDDNAAHGTAWYPFETCPRPDCVLVRAAQPPAITAHPVAPTTPLPDDRIRELWRSVQGPNAALTGPLIRFAGLLFEAGREQGASDLNWVRAQRDVAESLVSGAHHDQCCAVCGIKRAAHPGMAHAFVQLDRAAQPPAGAEAVREAFTAGFLAHIDQKTATQAVVLEQPYDWRFDGSPAADLEPQAWAAWTAPAPRQKEQP